MEYSSSPYKSKKMPRGLFCPLLASQVTATGACYGKRQIYALFKKDVNFSNIVTLLSSQHLVQVKRF